MFLRNAWYVAAWEREIGEGPTARTLLGDDIVLYRTPDGCYAALEDACPHRKLPMSMGRVHGNQLECGYHGLRFDPTGACVAAPTHGGPPPAGSALRAYAVEARYGLLWVWMGNPADADPDTIFKVDHWGDPEWGTTAGDDMVMECNYLYITDNLLDPSHVAWVHPSSFAGPGTDDTPMHTTIGDSGVTVWRWMMDSEPAPFYAPLLPFKGRTDRKQQYEVRYPSHAIIRAFFQPAGTGGEDKPVHPNSFLMDSYNFLTPVDERRTHYFWFQQRNVHPNDEEVSKSFAASVLFAFTEDKVILGAVQRGMEARRTPNIDLRSDAGGTRFRRRLAQMIEQEAAGS